ncbi:transcription termination factor NusB [Bradyrhizobium japonicum]|jgi:transcription termination factor NusB|uniref:Transcription termination factor NusB n=1 Tax=Bradyrhizobium elkanii TaxID=29448 RepID=A0ABV4F7U9_BRAEL
MRPAALDDIVLSNLKQRVLAPERIVELLKSLIERQAAKSESADHRLLALQKELSDAEDRLKRLYRSVEDGIAELDDILQKRSMEARMSSADLVHRNGLASALCRSMNEVMSALRAATLR